MIAGHAPSTNPIKKWTIAKNHTPMLQNDLHM